MVRAGRAVTLGLRAAARNPELAFGLGLLGVAQWLLAALPVFWSGALVWAALADRPIEVALLRMPRFVSMLGPAVAGALLAGAAIGWTLTVGLWAGALPLLAADAELQARPPAGAFWTLAARGGARVAVASAVSAGLSLLTSLALALGLLSLPLALGSGAPVRRWALAAALAAAALLWSLLVDLFGQLLVIRAAVLGDGLTAAATAAARLLGERLGAILSVAGASLLAQLLVGGAAGALAAYLNAAADLDAGAQLLALAPRAAVGLAAGVVAAYFETARLGALAVLAADQAGMLSLLDEPAPPAWSPQRPVQPARRRFRIPAPWELRPPREAVQPGPRRAEPVIEAEPVGDAGGGAGAGAGSGSGAGSGAGAGAGAGSGGGVEP